MKEIKILHLLPHLMSLYGEYGNIAVLKAALESMGFSVTVTGWESSDLDPAGYDFVYIGSGTEDNLMEAVNRLLPCRQAVKDSVEGGTVWLATGNAMALFGVSVERHGETRSALDLFPFTAQICDGTRYLGDALTEDFGGMPMVGFVNTSCVYQGIETPLWKLMLNPRLGNDKESPEEGILSGSFYGTQLIGPVLAKNPHFLSEICRRITGETPVFPEESNIRRAYTVSVDELKKRVP